MTNSLAVLRIFFKFICEHSCITYSMLLDFTFKKSNKKEKCNVEQGVGRANEGGSGHIRLSKFNSLQ